MDWLEVTSTLDFGACSFSIIAFAEGCAGSKRRFDNATEAWRLKKKALTEGNVRHKEVKEKKNMHRS